MHSFAIVTPSYQQARFLSATIRSVLDQHYPRLDHLVVDAGSTDGTIELLRQFDPPVRFVTEPDRGQADAINKGFGLTRGEILSWLNSDDMLAAGALERVDQAFAENPDVGLVYGDARFIDADGNDIGLCVQVEPFNRRRLLTHSDYIAQPAAFFRRSLFEQAGPLDISLHWAMDYDFFLKATQTARVLYLPRVLAHYRFHPAGKTASSGRDRIEEARKVVHRHGQTRLPAYFELELAAIDLSDAIAQSRRGRIDLGTFILLRAMANLLTNPRAVLTLAAPQTRRIIAARRSLRAAMQVREHAEISGGEEIEPPRAPRRQG
jgi:glycosyltransferase involved in cell wall biosynthesis